MEAEKDFKEKVWNYENQMSEFYKHSLLGSDKRTLLYIIASIWDTFSLSGGKRRHQYKMMLQELEELKEELGLKEYRGLKLRITTAFEN